MNAPQSATPAGDEHLLAEMHLRPVDLGPIDDVRGVHPFSTGSRDWEIEMRIVRAVLVPLFVVALVVLGAPGAPFAQIGVSISIAPPLLPVYVQPPIPGPGYIWTPGYWAWGPFGYYWVPGTWVLPPEIGLLWTPSYWGWGDGGFVFHAGYWGPTVGFYGGIDYGFGYTGEGYAGGYWSNGNFFYNRAVNNISNTQITNVYDRNVTVNRTTNVSFNGGPGGIAARPSPAELAAAQHAVGPTAAQVQQQRAASTNRALRASVNHGTPSIAATRRPGEFAGHEVVPARGAAPVRPVAGADHRTAATGALGGMAPRAVQIPQEHRYSPPQVRPGAEQRAAHESLVQRPLPQELASHPPASHERLPMQRQTPEVHSRAAHAGVATWARPRYAPPPRAPQVQPRTAHAGVATWARPQYAAPPRAPQVQPRAAHAGVATWARPQHAAPPRAPQTQQRTAQRRAER
jgi:hypothetical protein